jgi:hypothetical protein
MRDSLYDDVAVRVALLPAVRSANGTVNGPSIDMAGTRNYFRVAMLVVTAGEVTDGNHAVFLEHSDTGTGGWTAVSAGEREGSVPTITAANDNSVHKVGYAVSKRFVRASITTSGAPGTPQGGIISAVLLLTSGSGRPV